MSNDKTLLIQRIRDGSINKEKDLIGADLREANLFGADLHKSDLSCTDLSGANLSGVNLSGANLIKADLSKAILSKAILSGANLRFTSLHGANLYKANLYKANLHKANLHRANLTEADLRFADLHEADLSRATLIKADLSRAILSFASIHETDLSGASLCGAILNKARLCGAILNKANLSKTNLSKTNLSQASLSGVNLSGAVLVGTQALGTNFTKAILTGSCIEDWSINSKTRLDGVICEYIYLKQNEEERHPHGGTFAPEDFANLVQSSLETIDLIFREGLEWEAFAYAFTRTEMYYSKFVQLAVQSIENKSNGVVIVKIATSSNALKEEVHRFFMNGYKFASKAPAKQYERRLKYEKQLHDKDKHINSLILNFAKLSEISKAVAESKRGDRITSNQLESTIANNIGKANLGGQINEIQNITQGERQSLAIAAAEIQRLLKQLEETNPTATESEQISYVNVAIKPDLRKRAMAALKAGGETIIDEFVLENKGLKVVKSMLKEWLE